MNPRATVSSAASMQRIPSTTSVHHRAHHQLSQSGGHGVRVDTHVYAGYTIPPNYDSMIGKLIVSAQTREEAITKMERAWSGKHVIEGVNTTIPFHLRS